MKLNEINYKSWFLNYVKNYGEEPNIIIKRDHSIRVAKSMKEVFKNWNVDSEYLSLADFIGLYHDLGRFEQWKNYNTFVDSKSVDHANEGVRILFEPQIVSEVLKDRTFELIIFNSIYHHNKFSIPGELSFKDEWVFYRLKNFSTSANNIDTDVAISSLYTMAIRDADKLDILKQYLLSDNLLKSSDLPVTPKVANDFLNNKSILSSDRKNANDSILLRLAFINDINLTKFLKQIKSENLLEKMNELYPNKEVVQVYFDHAKKRLDELIENNKATQYVLKK